MNRPNLLSFLVTAFVMTGVLGLTTFAEETEDFLVEVTAVEYKFTPETIKVQPGQPVTIRFSNKGKFDHNWVLKLPGETVKFDRALEPEGLEKLYFTAPSQPGRYPFICPVNDHHKRGMTGVLVVEKPGE